MTPKRVDLRTIVMPDRVVTSRYAQLDQFRDGGRFTGYDKGVNDLNREESTAAIPTGIGELYGKAESRSRHTASYEVDSSLVDIVLGECAPVVNGGAIVAECATGRLREDGEGDVRRRRVDVRTQEFVS